MPKTNTFTVDGDSVPDAVIADIPAREVEVRENGAAGTTDYDVYEASTANVPIRRVAGEGHVFSAPKGRVFGRGEVVGFCKAAAIGTYVFSRKCH